jgi:alcohol dehydrogenase class IV
MLDALCQAIESWWSRKATPVSIDYSRRAIDLILKNMDSYLENGPEGNKNMLLASNLAGKAINVTTTTAPHAMSYKMTSLYNLPHGHAVALCLPKVWRYMKNHDCIAKALGKGSSEEAISFFEQLLINLGITPPVSALVEHLDILVNSVNTQRLQNSPVRFNKETIKILYTEILEV